LPGGPPARLFFCIDSFEFSVNFIVGGAAMINVLNSWTFGDFDLIGKWESKTKGNSVAYSARYDNGTCLAKAFVGLKLTEQVEYVLTVVLDLGDGPHTVNYGMSDQTPGHVKIGLTYCFNVLKPYIYASRR
jgi:hypothetical protein